MKLNFPTTAQPVLKRACKRKNTTSVISKKIVAILANLNSKKTSKRLLHQHSQRNSQNFSSINFNKFQKNLDSRKKEYSTSINPKNQFVQVQKFIKRVQIERKNTQHQSIQSVRSKFSKK